MAKRKDSFLELLVLAPWWVSDIVVIGQIFHLKPRTEHLASCIHLSDYLPLAPKRVE
jgi:hypothetical protein